MMKTLIKNELYKIMAGRKLHIFLVIGGMMTLILFFAANVLSIQLSEGEGFAQAATGLAFPLANLQVVAGLIAPLFVLLVVADQLIEEQKLGTLKLPLLSGIGRYHLLLSKFIALGIAITILMFALLVISYGVGLIGSGTAGEIVQDYSTWQGVLFTLLAYSVSVLPLLAVGGSVMLISLFVSSSSGLIGLTLGLALISGVISEVSSGLAPLILTTQLLFYDQMLQWVIGSLSGPNLLFSLGVIGGYLILSCLLAGIIFSRRDLLT